MYLLDWKTYLKCFNLFYLWSLYDVDLVLESPTMAMLSFRKQNIANAS